MRSNDQLDKNLFPNFPRINLSIALLLHQRFLTFQGGATAMTTLRFGLAVLAVALVGVTQQSSAGPIVYLATLTGPGENPPNASTATGLAEVDFDPLTQLMHVHVTFSGITSLTTASHIHSPAIPPATAGVATTVPSFPGFPLGVSSGLSITRST